MNTQWRQVSRDLKKLIDTLCRTAAVQLVKNEGTTLTVTKTNLEKYLGKKQLPP